MPGATDAAEPAIDGWWEIDGTGVPHLIGSKCPQCATYVFPPRPNNCPNPACDGDVLDSVQLSRRGTVWSYTENHYAPPPPFPAADPFEPFAVAAVELAAEGLIVLGKVADARAADLTVGAEMELTVIPHFVDDEGVQRSVYAWRRRAGDDAERGTSDEEERRRLRAGDDAERGTSDEEERRR